MAKVILIIVAILVLVGVAVFGYKMYKKNQIVSTISPIVTTQTTTPVMTASPAASATSTSNSDSSNSAIDSDLKNVQGNLNKLGSDQSAANTDTSSQDTPPAQ